MRGKIGVLVGESWGAALAILLANKGHDVQTWLRYKKHEMENIVSDENKFC